MSKQREGALLDGIGKESCPKLVLGIRAVLREGRLWGLVLPGPWSLAPGCHHHICPEPVFSVPLPRAPGPQLGWVVEKEAEALQLVHGLGSKQRLGRGAP